MAKLFIQANSTAHSEYVFIQDSSSTVGEGLTGLVFNSAGLTASYCVERGARTAITLVTLASATAAYTSGGFIAVDGTNMPGLYRFDVPNALFSVAGTNNVVVMLRGATNMAPVLLEYQIVAFDPNDAVRLGLTALPNANAGASGGLPTGNASGQVTVAGTASGAITNTSFAAGAIDAAAIASDAITSAELATSAIDEIADGILNRNIAGGSSSGRLVKDAFRAIRNKSVISAGTLTVYQEDDTTSAWTATVGSDPTAEPIISIDPA